jgi:hypothetical protein
VFVELTERRNLLVHCNGVVSAQYLKNCAEHKAKIPKNLKLGQQLGVSPEYFNSSYRCIFELTVKLTHVLWRKLMPNELEYADSTLNDICYDLIENEEYDLAISLLDFATDILKKHYSDEARLTFVINRAQAYKWTGKKQVTLSLLAKEDWTAASDKFRLAEAVLRDDYSKACIIMKEMGAESKVNKSLYRDWPLFKEFRKRPEFHRTFQEVFKEPFNKADAEPETDSLPSISLN